MTTVTHAIIKTLAYADIFDYPLTNHEIWKFLIGKRLKYSHFIANLQSLERNHAIIKSNGFYALKGRKQLVSLRKERYNAAQKKMMLGRQTAQLLSQLPTVWFVGISGAVAMGNAPSDDDIDLFIVTAPQTLWLTRFLCVLLLDLLGRRRKPGQLEVTNKICLNMFMDSAKLALPYTERDLYSAHELVQLVPVSSKFGTYENFLSANAWIRSYLPHSFIPLRKIQKKKPPSAAIRIANTLLEQWQLSYMRRRRTSEVIKSSMLRFHPLDAREWIRAKYAERLKTVGIRFTASSFSKG